MTVRILCVDDDKDGCEMICVFLQTYNPSFAVTPVRSAKDALKAIESEKFDIYIIDGGSQQLAGLSFCGLVRGWDEDGVIVFLSDNEGDKTDALNSGADIYLLKPRDIHKITTVIDDLLDYERAASVISQRL